MIDIKEKLQPRELWKEAMLYSQVDFYLKYVEFMNKEENEYQKYAHTHTDSHTCTHSHTLIQTHRLPIHYSQWEIPFLRR